MTLRKKFGRVLRIKRLAKKQTQEDLAWETGFDVSYIYRLESGKTQPTLESLFTLAEALGIKPSELIISLQRMRR